MTQFIVKEAIAFRFSVVEQKLFVFLQAYRQ